MNFKKFNPAYMGLIILALILSACTLGQEAPQTADIDPQATVNALMTQQFGALTQTAEVAPNTPVPTFTPTATSITPPTLTPTSTPFPTFTPTAEIAFDGILIKDCPDASMGYHPDSGEKLEFDLLPYVDKKTGLGDTNVICVYEAFSLEKEIKVDFSEGVVAIAADWSHGTYNDDGTLKDACPTGWECEGTWVAREDIIIPIGTIVRLYVYKQEQPAKQRFTETISWTQPVPGSMAPFACEYIAKEGHDMRNIRVPAWALGGKNTIYGFALPLGVDGHLTCPGYETWDPTPTP